ncbi:hypothetical protein M3484_03440 [Pseudomonas sp. GX19020]|nr:MULTISPECIES: hypothetical protein [Pseudomonadota]MCL4065625.1 hypothetical protein [Pseudomonas sp. GX19020]SEB69836.1 hypothetical protein SAMN05519105_1119 [Rhodobacter sp. 24-YEA-8]
MKAALGDDAPAPEIFTPALFTSARMACGGNAGDPETRRAALWAAPQ